MKAAGATVRSGDLLIVGAESSWALIVETLHPADGVVSGKPVGSTVSQTVAVADVVAAYRRRVAATPPKET